MRSHAFSAVVLALCVAGGVSSARAAVIYGGPTYDGSTGTGYASPELPVNPGSSAGNGVAVASASKYAGGTWLGTRAVRWDTTGWTEMGNLGSGSGGFTFSEARAINASGSIVGRASKYAGSADLGTRAVRWEAGGTTARELGHLGTDDGGYTQCFASAINTSGTAAGYARKYTAGTYLGNRAVRWDVGGVTTELGNLGADSDGYTESYANAINASGATVGSGRKYTGGTYFGSRAVRWEAPSVLAIELGHLGTDSSGKTETHAGAINTSGTAVGFARKYTVGTDVGLRAVRWDARGTAATELGNLGTSSGGVSHGYAVAVNAAGTAVGSVQKHTGGTEIGMRAVRWDASSTVATELAHLGTDGNGVTNSYANAINTSGTAVGWAEAYPGGTFAGNRAVFWGDDAMAIDLNTLLSPADATLWTLSRATAISDTNWVTGIGWFDADGPGPLGAYNRLFLIQIPEPANLCLLPFATGALLRRSRLRVTPKTIG